MRGLAALLILVAAPISAAPGSASVSGPGSLTIDRAVSLALARDERAADADDSVVRADADVDRARAFFFPDLAATATYRFRGDPGQFQDRNVLDAELAARLTLFDGRGVPLYRAARRARDAAGHDRAEARRRVAFEAAGGFLAALGAQAVLAAADSRVELARQNLAAARGRAEAGLASSNDATRATLELSNGELERDRAQGQLRAARLRLSWLIGVAVEGRLEVPDALYAAATRDEASSAAARAPARRARPDVAALAAQAAAADARAEEPLWRWLPSVGLVGAAGASSVGGITGKTSDWFVGLAAAWQLFDGGVRTADRAARLAEARIAERQVARASRTAALEVETARSALATARATVGAADRAAAAARRNLDESRALYAQGLARAIEVADASSQLFAAEVALARERVALGLALLDVRDAVGGQPLEEIR